MKRLLVLAAIAAAATPALAGPLAFSSDPGPALDTARALMSEERGTPLTDEVVSVALVDLDGDGTQEIFAFADASYFCGSAGCVPRLYRLEPGTGRWSELPIESEAFINGDPSMWTVGETGPGGWLDLVFAASDATLTFTWNGEAYTDL